VYSETVKDHFVKPRNAGEFADPEASGSGKNVSDGDQVQLQFRITDGVIVDARMKVMGCVVAIASSSMLTEMVKGKTVKDALSLSKENLVEKLGGLPEHKIRCSLTCMDALQSALEGWKG
jgi:NifU-like protein involved in Fe-S cluster formation